MVVPFRWIGEWGYYQTNLGALVLNDGGSTGSFLYAAGQGRWITTGYIYFANDPIGGVNADDRPYNPGDPLSPPPNRRPRYGERGWEGWPPTPGTPPRDVVIPEDELRRAPDPILHMGANTFNCGPDVGTWLTNQMLRNAVHPVILDNADPLWFIPPLMPVKIGFMLDFKELVRAKGWWAFKHTVTFGTASCPGIACAHTVTLCGLCVDRDVVGNIHYGYVGRAAAFRRWFLLWQASLAQPGGIDPAHDRAAVEIGIDLYEEGSATDPQALCRLVLGRSGELNYRPDNAPNCCPCFEELTEPKSLGWNDVTLQGT